ncbi:MAG TPA: gluconate 2-dehydrogenase subunit 3 family protein [Candidatus Aquilonibacter sp.]
MSDRVSRKDFVAIVGTATAAAAVPTAATAAGVPATAAAPPMEMAATTKQHGGMAPLGNEPEAYTYFTEPEAAFIEAAVERLIPTDQHGPGARSAGVAFFIDQQLVGAFGTAAKMYRTGPWDAGTPMQGYQLRQTPAEVYRQGIAGAEAYCNKTYQKGFAQLSAAHQDEVLKGLDGGTIKFDVVPAKAFFEMLLQNTIEGFFGDPLYGGNRDKAGWKLVGFPGVAAYYANKITDYNKPYHVPPVSIADVQQGHPVAEGHELMHHMAMENAKRLNEVNQ